MIRAHDLIIPAAKVLEPLTAQVTREIPLLEPVPMPDDIDARALGTAFDYSLRYLLKKVFPKRIKNDDWICETALKLELRIILKNLLAIDERNKVERDRLLYWGIQNKKAQQSIKDIKERIETARMIDLSELAFYGAFSSIFDPILRTNFGYTSVGLWRKSNIHKYKRPITRMLNKVPIHKFNAKTLWNNPTLGFGNDNFGVGADADIVCDDTIIDIKCVKKQRVSLDNLRQLFIYLLFARRHGKGCLKHVKRASIFFGFTGEMIEFGDLTKLDNFNIIEKHFWNELPLWVNSLMAIKKENKYWARDEYGILDAHLAELAVAMSPTISGRRIFKRVENPSLSAHSIPVHLWEVAATRSLGLSKTLFNS